MRKLLLLAATACALSANAQDPIDQIVNTIVYNSPELASQRVLVDAQRADDSDANSLADPEVAFARVWGRHGIGNKLQLDVTQSFDWPGVYGARRRASVLGQTVADLQVQANAMEINKKATAQLVELVYVRKQIALVDMLLEDMVYISEATKKASHSGMMTILDEKKLAFETYELENQNASLHARECQILTELQSMCPSVRLDMSQVNAYPMVNVLSATEYKDMARRLDPNLLMLVATASQEDANATVATRSRFPGFSVGYQHQAEMGDRFNGFTVSMSLPFFQNRHARTAALIKKDAAETSYQSALEQTYASIDAALAEATLWRAQINKYQQVFGDNSYLTLLKKAYDGGELGLIEYLSEVHYYHQTTFNYLEAEYNYYNAVSSIKTYE